MKVLFSADWHIKLGQKNVPREWQIARYRAFFAKINEIECDIHVIGGDIFDKIPSIEELQLYFEFIAGSKHDNLIFDGNHEATKKGHSFLHNLKDVTKQVSVGVSEVITEPRDFQGMDFIPYTHLKTFKPEDFHNDILFTHVRGEILPHVHPEIDLTMFDRWGTVFAGDLHAHSNSQRNIVYPGSPLTIAFHRNPVKNGVIVFDSDAPREYEWIELGLPQLLRQTVSTQEAMVATEYDHTIYELEGNLSEISNADRDNELLDKTIVHKTTEAQLNLKDKSIAEEVDLYLSKVLNIKDTKEYMGTFNDYYKNATI